MEREQDGVSEAFRIARAKCADEHFRVAYLANPDKFDNFGPRLVEGLS